jgi:TetR/AcrR family transcriptional regulator, transcriptional repressor for nem operon
MADFFESTLAGIRIAAKAGKSRRSLRNMAAFASRAYLGIGLPLAIS